MNKKWTDEELKDSVKAYLDMLNKYNTGIDFTKKHYYEELAHKYNRTAKSFEYRMQNISYVFYLLGKSYLPGLKPKQNVGQKHIEKIKFFINELESLQFIPQAAFEASVIKALKSNRNIDIPQGIIKPQQQSSQIYTYSRDIHVKAWLLKNAHGVCEVCNQSAPFNTIDGLPFLEVHHIKRLSDGGSDTITNAIAICPNCHRELHYGANKEDLLNNIYKTIKRIKPE